MTGHWLGGLDRVWPKQSFYHARPHTYRGIRKGGFHVTERAAWKTRTNIPVRLGHGSLGLKPGELSITPWNQYTVQQGTVQPSKTLWKSFYSFYCDFAHIWKGTGKSISILNLWSEKQVCVKHAWMSAVHPWQWLYFRKLPTAAITWSSADDRPACSKWCCINASL